MVLLLNLDGGSQVCHVVFLLEAYGMLPLPPFSQQLACQ
jgi:hypothetical protein